MNLTLIADLFKPAVKLIDDLHTSKEEKLDMQVQLESIRKEVVLTMLEYESSLAKSKAKIISAEAAGASWLQRVWRPVTMIFFLVLIAGDIFGLSTYRLPEQAWTLLQIGLGGYVVGRSGEKIIPRMVGNQNIREKE